MLWTVADFWYPTLGLAILNAPLGCVNGFLNPYNKLRENVCGTKYQVSSTSSYNMDSLYLLDPTDIRLGLSIMPRLARTVSLRIAFDLQHGFLQVGENYWGLQGVDLSKLFHAGVEIFIGNPLERYTTAIRFGSGQGFASYGISLDLLLLKIEFAAYGVDIGSYSKPQEDRRFLFSLSSDI